MFATKTLPGELSRAKVKEKVTNTAPNLEFRDDVSFNTFHQADIWLEENAHENALCVKVNLWPGKFAWMIGAEVFCFD